jgi:hypothetical protein
MPLKSRITLLIFSAVFALAFGLGGVVAGVKPMANLLQDAWKARTYVAIPAQVLEVNLTRGGKSSLAVEARYRYELNGKTYESNRVGLHGGNADNIGDWQTQWHRKLLNAYKAQRTITVWVDPLNPADAVIDRNIRWLMLLFLLPFALFFPAVSLGAMWFFFKTWAAHPTRLDTAMAPDPKLDTVTPYLPDNNKNAAGFIWFFAVFWNLLCWPLALLTWLDRGITMVSLFVSVFPIVGLILLRLAIKTTAQARRARGTTVTAQPRQPRPGETLVVGLTLPAHRLAKSAQFELTLIEGRIRDHDSSRTVVTVWSQKQKVMLRQKADGQGTAELSFDLPLDALPSDALEDGARTVWSLDLVDLGNQDEQSFALTVRESVAQVARTAKTTPFDSLPLNTWTPVSDTALDTAGPISSMVMRTHQRRNVWSAVFPSWLGRLVGLLCMGAAVYALVMARGRFLGSSGNDALWALAWLGAATAALGLGLHGLSTARRLRVDQRGLTITAGSWLWRWEQHLARSEIGSYAKKHVSLRGRHAPNRRLFEVYAATRTGEKIQLSPAVVHGPVADAIAGKVRDALANHALLFAPQGDTETAPPSRALLGYGLWGAMALIGLTAVSLNSTFRLGDPVSIERMLKDWTIRLERLSPGGRAFEAVADAQDRSDLAALKALLEQGANPNTPANNGISLLMIAARRGNLANVELLLKHGANVNQRDETSNDNRGDTALLVALYAGQEQVVHRLLKAGARMDVKNMWDWGPMHMAAQSDCIACLELVRSHGVPLNNPAPASRGETPAMLAAARGRLESLKWFELQGVDLRQEDPHGKTALDWAEFARRENTAQWIRLRLSGQAKTAR